MSDVVTAAVDALNARLDGTGFDGIAKFVIMDEGSIIIDNDGARASKDMAGDHEADVTLTADTDTFQQIIEGDLNPTTAFMSGRMKIDGDMGAAMRLGGVLS
ncbi:SCP2 sterol-binding domain-containing protein [Salipiger aestuarii]|uniref:SCP-2 sterol transfer family protein n=1 Tax=Salipiger aestuarii TaxID=568098 RepID=A0A327YE44_9RHOB|nr:SCP2 sterol-binding domain-containing protein [Salipiger aestuarii]EIE50867.1 sterol-binding domain protein [Citreicella sp. 357]KAA8611189.1 sterol carrier family protein [Salipiger aestuarii]KAB2541941.1 sterol carrier family protein [Salipiger aestuarii]RAK18135.1 SCP-2 sterol transfer family protein [Salipiger aestuarii]